MDYCEITLKGRLGQDPEVKITNSGKHVCMFTVASNKKYVKDKTNWYNVIAWGDVADAMRRFRKGQTVRIRGDGDFDEYTNRNGDKVRQFNVTVLEIMWDGDYDQNRTIERKSAADVQYDSAEKNDTAFENQGDDDLPF